MNPFDVLLPELWALIRDHLQTQWNGRSRVALQRVCKAAAALDPGIILAPAWQEIHTILQRDVSPPVFWQRQIDLWDAMAEIDKSRLLEAEWCAPVEADVVCKCPNSTAWSFGLWWDVVPWIGISFQYKSTPIQLFWKYQMLVVKPGDPMNVSHKVNSVLASYPTVAEALRQVPLLGMGYHPLLIKTWAEEGVLQQRVLRQ
jgi:hypothetical protein